MPQLAPYGLSENWLLRHAGDLHWQAICHGLCKRSRDICDQHGDRLYASFVRVAWTSTAPLGAFQESDELTGELSLVRVGDGLYISETSLASEAGTIALRLATMFTRRAIEGSNRRLIQSAPDVPASCPIPDIETVPDFVVAHGLLRRGRLARIDLAGHAFDTSDPAGDPTPYRINGFYDFNGAHLLYFAAYPTIADTCAAFGPLAQGRVGAFTTQCSPIARDVFYFGNAELTSTLHCAIAPVRSPGALAYRADLFRDSDDVCISRQFVVRQALRS